MNWYTGIVLYELVERWHELRRRWSSRGEAGHLGEPMVYGLVCVFIVLAILVMIGKL